MRVTDETIVSRYNGKRLSARKYDATQLNASCVSIAIVAHPYGPLGGSQNDAVVVSLAQTLASCGLRVFTFNFQSPTSWRGERERADYLAVLKSAIDGASDARHIVCCGYSYGSLCLPSPNVLKVLQPDASISYVAVSPLLPPVSTALTLSTKDAYASMRGSTNELSTSTLAVFGDADQFTSSKRLERVWQGHGRTVNGADHFWRSERHLKALLDHVRSFIDAHAGSDTPPISCIS